MFKFVDQACARVGMTTYVYTGIRFDYHFSQRVHADEAETMTQSLDCTSSVDLSDQTADSVDTFFVLE